MMQQFNQNMYDHKRVRLRAVEFRQDAAQTEEGIEPNGDNRDAEMAEILNNVEELFGQPVFPTHQSFAH